MAQPLGRHRPVAALAGVPGELERVRVRSRPQHLGGAPVQPGPSGSAGPGRHREPDQLVPERQRPLPLGEERLPDAQSSCSSTSRGAVTEHRGEQVEVDRGAEDGRGLERRLGRAGTPQPAGDGLAESVGHVLASAIVGAGELGEQERVAAAACEQLGRPVGPDQHGHLGGVQRLEGERHVRARSQRPPGRAWRRPPAAGSSRRRRTCASQAQVTGSAPSASSSTSAVPVPAGSDRTASSRCAKTPRLRASIVAPGPGSPVRGRPLVRCHVGEPVGQRVEDRLQGELARLGPAAEHDSAARRCVAPPTGRAARSCRLPARR